MNSAPLRHSQYQMLKRFGSQGAASGVSNLFRLLKFPSAVPTPVLHQALKNLIGAQDIFQVEIAKEGNEYLQRVAARAVPIAVLSARSESDAEAIARERVISEPRPEAAYLNVPLCDFFIVTFPSGAIVGLSVSHLLTDGEGIAMLADAFCGVVDSTKEPDHFRNGSYIAYVASEVAWLNGPEAKDASEYWFRLFNGYRPPDIPRRTSVQPYQQKKLSVDIDVSVLGRRLLKSRHGPFTGLLSVFCCALSNFFDCPRIAVRAAASGRSCSFSRRSFGAHVNAFAVCLPSKRSETGNEFLRHSFPLISEAIANQKSFRLFDMEPTQPTTTDFQFVYNEIDRGASQANSLVFPPPVSTTSPLAGTNCKLRLNVYLQPGGLDLVMHYNPEFIEQTSASTVLLHCRTLLLQISAPAGEDGAFN
ncbi:hypothetical protein I6F07_17360 [Ensifer sp. IC4062]|nr:hypothetical protein [Ensifer sp. IC4062]